VYILIGIGAAFLVPLFLQLISSDILEKANENHQFLTFFSFCVLAAISSEKFITSISQKFLKELNEVKNTVGKVQKEVEPMINKYTEPDLDVIRVESLKKEFENLTELDMRVLRLMNNSEYTFRSITGMAADLNMSHSATIRSLNRLNEIELIGISADKSRDKYYLSSKAKAYLAMTGKSKKSNGK
jgi:predicted transcriptional regulator